MTDRELLELAAKAAGIKALRCPNGVLRDCTGLDPAMNIFSAPEWNPFISDGDALRLAVTCQLTVCTDGDATVSASEAWRDRDPNAAFVTQSVRECGDKHAATRRAIVRAAAELGRSKT